MVKTPDEVGWVGLQVRVAHGSGEFMMCSLSIIGRSARTTVVAFQLLMRPVGASAAFGEPSAIK